MELHFNGSLAEGYRSGSQIARVPTETWVGDNMFCPRCGCPHIRHFKNNRPVADFFCPDCHGEFELKSKRGVLGGKVADGAYDTMIARITGNQNPDFFFLSYSLAALSVTDLLFVPSHFFVPDIIEKRKPLSDTARRAGWVGCNILLDGVPEQGRVEIVVGGAANKAEEVVAKVNRGRALETRDVGARGWLLDVLSCVNKVGRQVFSLSDIYLFDELLHAKHPDNNNVRPKIRQQLQLLRDRGFVEFLGGGQYRKL